jgi:hypothetical protein
VYTPGVKIVAQREGGDYLLIETRKDMGRVWDRAFNELFPEQSQAAILKFGYWTDYTGSESAEDIVQQANRNAAPPLTRSPR